MRVLGLTADFAGVLRAMPPFVTNRGFIRNPGLFGGVVCLEHRSPKAVRVGQFIYSGSESHGTDCTVST